MVIPIVFNLSLHNIKPALSQQYMDYNSIRKAHGKKLPNNAMSSHCLPLKNIEVTLLVKEKLHTYFIKCYEY